MKRNRLLAMGCGLLLSVSCVVPGAAGVMVYAEVQDSGQLESPAGDEAKNDYEEQNLDSSGNELDSSVKEVGQPENVMDDVSESHNENGDFEDLSDLPPEEDYLDVTVDESQLQLKVNRAFKITLNVSGGEPPYRIYGYYGPDWVQVDGIELKGIPTEPGEYLFSYEVRDANDKASWGLDFALVVGEEVETIPFVRLPSDDGLITLVAGEAFKLPLIINGGTPPYTYEFYGAPDWMKIEGDYFVGKPDKVYDEFLIGLGVSDANSPAGDVYEYTIKVVEKEPEILQAVQDEKKGPSTPKVSSYKTEAVQTRDTAPVGTMGIALLTACVGTIGIIWRGKKYQKMNK